MLLLPLAPPPALVEQRPKTQAPAAPRLSFDQAVYRLLDAYDLGAPLGPEPPLPPKERAAYRWLRACASGKAPANPFPAGSPAHQEAQALRAFLVLPKAEALHRLPELRTKELGTHLALWRWGKDLSRRGAFTKAERRTFEDRLLAAPGPDLSRGYALRHALSFALAEKDEARLGELRGRVPEGQEDLYAGFQSAFGLLSGPLPPMRLWTLPGGQAQDEQLGADGAPVWMAPAPERELPALPPGMQWVIPSATGGQDLANPRLVAGPAAEAQGLEARLLAAHRSARFAASRTAFDKLGLVYFPILLRFDAKGNVAEILMGDAAPKGPGEIGAAGVTSSAFQVKQSAEIDPLLLGLMPAATEHSDSRSPQEVYNLDGLEGIGCIRRGFNGVLPRTYLEPGEVDPIDTPFVVRGLRTAEHEPGSHPLGEAHWTGRIPYTLPSR